VLFNLQEYKPIILRKIADSYRDAKHRTPNNKQFGYGNHHTDQKNKPAYKALITLARELRKSDESSIVISESYLQDDFDVISPLTQNAIPDSIFDELSDFPSFEELRKQAWPKS
jgi:hypothetical protein